ncbi:MAG TPA: hypothetical protein ENH99_01395 [Candidatus Pacearchaeota archaeon]|nr:hypothetical protein [Candidatus Pacearchaeota archaeon]
MKYDRILIVGGIGSGKTTLANKLSKILNIKHYELDNIAYKTRDVWVKFGYPERKKKLNKIFKRKTWILEGFYSTPWTLSVYKKADLVIILEVKKTKAKIRVFKRFLKRKFLMKKNKKVNKSLKGVIKIIKHINLERYEKKIKKAKGMAKKHSKKYMILKNKKEINNFIKEIK